MVQTTLTSRYKGSSEDIIHVSMEEIRDREKREDEEAFKARLEEHKYVLD